MKSHITGRFFLTEFTLACKKSSILALCPLEKSTSCGLVRLYSPMVGLLVRDFTWFTNFRSDGDSESWILLPSPDASCFWNSFLPSLALLSLSETSTIRSSDTRNCTQTNVTKAAVRTTPPYRHRRHCLMSVGMASSYVIETSSSGLQKSKMTFGYWNCNGSHRFQHSILYYLCLHQKSYSTV